MLKQYSIEELDNIRKTKKELFEQLADEFDYTLPQDWLNDFADWCVVNYPNVTYDLIRSTTVWSYAQGNYISGFPVTVSKEVDTALQSFRR
jgi:hypothetical protein